jgi:tRNA (cmo5U34)-methyltransferase
MHAQKSTVEEIRARFDRSVDRFVNSETGQTTIMDAPLALDLIASAVERVSPRASHLLDVGCGAGNYSLKIREKLPTVRVTLIDLSRPMLDRAVERLARPGARQITAAQGDIRDLEIGNERFDVIVAAMVLHHLRGEEEWRAVFHRLWAALKPGGSLWISDLVDHGVPEVGQLLWERYGEYLTRLKDAAYREEVFAYVKYEDSPRPLLFQCELLKEVGFESVDVLHKNSCFAVFGAVKGGKGRTAESRL